MIKLIIAGIVAFIIMYESIPASVPKKESPVSASLVTANRSIRAGDTLTVAVRLKMSKHWHTYWRNAGDAGLPTTIDWSLPEGVTAGDIRWPRPEFLVESNIESFIYSGEVFLLADIFVPSGFSGNKIDIAAEISWLMCKEECIPGKVKDSLSIPVKSMAPAYDVDIQRKIVHYKSMLPQKPEGWEFSAGREGGQVTLHIHPPHEITGKIMFYPYKSGIFDVKKESVIHNVKNLKMSIPLQELRIEEPEILHGIITSPGKPGSGEFFSYEINVPVN